MLLFFSFGARSLRECGNIAYTLVARLILITEQAGQRRSATKNYQNVKIET